MNVNETANGGGGETRRKTSLFGWEQWENVTIFVRREGGYAYVRRSVNSKL